LPGGDARKQGSRFMTEIGRPVILLVEDTRPLALAYAQYLANEPYQVVAVETGAQALEALARQAPAAILLDLQLPDIHGLEVLKWIRAKGLPTVAIVITAHGSINNAVEAMREGAFDFLVKPFAAERLRVTLRNAVESQRLRTLVDTFKEQFQRDQFHGFVGRSLAMQTVYRMIESAAPSKATVFITGESGTGKELCAQAIHRLSPRRDKPFMALNCGAIPRDLLESELFGHVKGAFTGAVSDHAGAALAAHGGTLFLDEICDMDINLQTKLLRFLQMGVVQRVGETQPRPVDVRIICATNRDPLVQVKADRFREDLYYRLQVIPIEMPPLRAREDDAVVIARDFLHRFGAEEHKKFKSLSPEVEDMLAAYDWPGNVRQLENVVRNIVVIHDGEQVLPEMVPAPVGGVGRPPARPKLPLATDSAPADDNQTPELAEPMPQLWEIERDAIEKTILLCQGSIPRAARILGVSPSTIYRKREAWAARRDNAS
jgi:DNA-binding NtrC family response regulator